MLVSVVIISSGISVKIGSCSFVGGCFPQMPHAFEIRIPCPRRVGLIARNRCISITHIENGVGGGGHSRHFYPVIHHSGGSRVCLYLPIQDRGASGIRSENNVVPLCICHTSPASSYPQVWLATRAVISAAD